MRRGVIAALLTVASVAAAGVGWLLQLSPARTEESREPLASAAPVRAQSGAPRPDSPAEPGALDAPANTEFAAGGLAGAAAPKVAASARDALGRGVDPEADLLVRVLDAQGQPLAHVPVWLARRENGRLRSCASASTRAPDGIAVLERGRYRFDPERELALAAGAPLESLFEPIAAPPPAGEAATIALGATRSVHVRCQRADGLPIRRPLLLSIEAPAGQPAADRIERMLSAPEWEWKFAPVGKSFVIGSRLQGFSASACKFTVPSDPAAACELVLTHTLEFVCLNGRALDADGKRLARTSIACELLASEPSGESADDVPLAPTRDLELRPARPSDRTLEDGSFEFRLPAALPAGRHRVRISAGNDSLGHRVRELEFELAEGQDEVPLGGLRLESAQILASGRVLDPQGHGLESARLRVETVEPGGSPARSLGSAVSQDEGHFVVYGSASGARTQLRAEASRYLLRAPLPLSDDPTRLLVRLAPLHTLHVELAGLPKDAILPELEVQLEGAHGRSSAALSAGADSVRFDDLRDGAYVARARVRGQPEPLAEARVELAPPADPLDDEHQSVQLELAAQLRWVELRIEDEDGRPIEAARVARLDARGQAEFEGAATGGSARVWAEQGAVDLRVEAEGFLSRVQRGLRSGDRVVLARGPELVLRVRLPADRPAHGSFEAELVSLPMREQSGANPRPVTAEWIGPREALLRLRSNGAGNYAILVSLVTRTEGPPRTWMQRITWLSLSGADEEREIELEAMAAGEVAAEAR